MEDIFTKIFTGWKTVQNEIDNRRRQRRQDDLDFDKKRSDMANDKTRSDALLLQTKNSKGDNNTVENVGGNLTKTDGKAWELDSVVMRY